MHSTRSRSWPYLAAAYLALLFVLDLLAGTETVLVNLYGLAPVGALLAGCSSRIVARIAVAAIVLAAASELLQHETVRDQGGVRLVTVAALGAMAWWASQQAERRGRTAERERFLAEVSDALSIAPGQSEAFQSVARLAVPRLADACAISRVGPAGERERLAVAGEVDLLQTGEEVVMVARGRPVGALALASRHARGGDSQERALAGRVAERCALALDAANLLVESQEAQDQLLEAFGLLDVLFDRAPVGLAFWDRELRFVRVNQRLAEINGAPAEAHAGQTVAQMAPGVPGLFESQRRVLESGEPLIDFEVAGETPAATGVRREWTASFWPVRRHGHDDDVIGLGGVVVEVTDRRAAERALREQTERFETLLAAVSQTGEGMVVLDGERLVYANQAFLDLSGYSHDELTAMASIYDLVIDEDRKATRRRAELRLDGRREPGTQLRLRRRDGQVIRLDLAGVRQEIAGRPQLVIVARDVTERSRIEAEREALLTRTRFLAEASAVFDEVLDEERTLQSVARLCVRELADTCVILTGSSAGAVRRVATVAREPGDEARLRELNERYPLAERRTHPLFEVQRTGQTRRFVHDESTEAMGQDERHRDLIRSFSMRSSILVPLSARGRTVGVMALGFAAVVDEAAIELFEDLGRRAALAIDNARLYEERTATARTLQRSLLPPELPEIPGIELAARYVAAGEGNEVGGDFYDCFATGGGDWALVIGDVCGKGAEAAVVTALARYTLRASATLHSDRPSHVLSELNDAILSQSADQRFCTVLYASVSPHAGGVTACMATGGHPLPMLLRADGRVEQPGRPGTLLGILPDPEISTEEIELEPGDALILFTDGVTEASPLDDAFGPDRLAEFVAGCAGVDAAELAQRIRDAALEIQGGSARDDVAVLVLRVGAGEGASFARAGQGVAAQA